jgi:hypothetical protein
MGGFTPSAAGLTMKRATKIAKAFALAPNPTKSRKILDYSLAAVVPPLMPLKRQRLSHPFQHRVTQMADLKASVSGHGASKLNPIKKSKDLPIHTSKTALRDAHRLQRSQPMHCPQSCLQVHSGNREQEARKWLLRNAIGNHSTGGTLMSSSHMRKVKLTNKHKDLKVGITLLIACERF